MNAVDCQDFPGNALTWENRRNWRTRYSPYRCSYCKVIAFLGFSRKKGRVYSYAEKRYLIGGISGSQRSPVAGL